MIEVIAKIQLCNGAEEDIIGIKDALASVVEGWKDNISFDIRTNVPSQLELDGKGGIRQSVTVAAAREALEARNLTQEELKNIAQALVEVSNI